MPNYEALFVKNRLLQRFGYLRAILRDVSRMTVGLPFFIAFRYTEQASNLAKSQGVISEQTHSAFKKYAQWILEVPIIILAGLLSLLLGSHALLNKMPTGGAHQYPRYLTQWGTKQFEKWGTFLGIHKLFIIKFWHVPTVWGGIWMLFPLLLSEATYSRYRRRWVSNRNAAPIQYLIALEQGLSLIAIGLSLATQGILLWMGLLNVFLNPLSIVPFSLLLLASIAGYLEGKPDGGINDWLLERLNPDVAHIQPFE